MNTKHLKQIVTAPESYFERYGDVSNYNYIFQDNEAKVLAVAHLDIAIPDALGIYARDKNLVWSPALDDRLGAWLILHHLSQHCKFDVLLTTDEEKMQSTAMYFDPPRDYNWMFQFDRAGATCVMYQYDTPLIRSMLTEHKLIPSVGSYTDIVELDHIGCKGINFGTFYFDQHSYGCHADLDLLAQQVKKFIGFFNDYKDTKLEHKSTWSRFVGEDDYYDDDDVPFEYYYDDDNDDLTEQCIVCGDMVAPHDFSYGLNMCYLCVNRRFKL
jgi:hypothetical protein